MSFSILESGPLPTFSSPLLTDVAVAVGFGGDLKSHQALALCSPGRWPSPPERPSVPPLLCPILRSSLSFRAIRLSSSSEFVAIMILANLRQAGLRKARLCAPGSLDQTRPAYLQRLFSHYLWPSKRQCSTSAVENSGESEEREKIKVTFVDKEGEEKEIKVPVGMSMLEAAHANDIELEGACEGSLACSTCHVIVMDVDYYNKMEDPTDEENDMLDLAFGLTQTSRLGCQIVAKPELDGMRLALPAATRNFAVDGFVPKPH